MILLDTAQATTVQGERNNSWVFSVGGQEVMELPKIVDEFGAMAVINFAKDYERQAYDRGMQDGKDAMLAANRQKMMELQALCDGLKRENERLSDILENNL